jgi:uracil-DNA glycosylase family 4
MRGVLQNGAARADGLAESLMAWWSLAGVDSAISDAPVSWLVPASPRIASPDRPARPAEPVARRAPTTPPDAGPADLASFHRWLAESADVIEAAWPGPRIVPGRQAGAPLMIVTDMPDSDDLASGTLLSGEAGRLVDGMLRALGLDRAACAIASLAVARPIGGIIDDRDLERLGERMRRQVALSAPARVLLLGDRTDRALGATDGSMPGQSLRAINHGGGTVDGVAIPHPRLLLRQPGEKAGCWRQLQLLLKDRN